MSIPLFVKLHDVRDGAEVEVYVNVAHIRKVVSDRPRSARSYITIDAGCSFVCKESPEVVMDEIGRAARLAEKPARVRGGEW